VTIEGLVASSSNMLNAGSVLIAPALNRFAVSKVSFKVLSLAMEGVSMAIKPSTSSSRLTAYKLSNREMMNCSSTEIEKGLSIKVGQQ
jgi:hypothetical protein